ncbi:MAG: hypothetical protein J6U10_07790 [Lachnospiraceae bacterium]|nr:hypothetical protein [Lachnospiraceae bacterium]
MGKLLLLPVFLLIALCFAACGKQEPGEPKEQGGYTLKLTCDKDAVTTPENGAEPAQAVVTAKLYDSNMKEVEWTGLASYWSAESASDTGYTLKVADGDPPINPPEKRQAILYVDPSFNYGDINGQDVIIKVRMETMIEKEFVAEASVTVHVNMPESDKEISPSPTGAEETAVYDIPRDLDEAAYCVVISGDKVAGSTVTVPVSGMAGYHTGSIFQVTRLFSDNRVDSFDVTENAGNIEFATDGAVKIEVSPVFRFVFGTQKNEISPSDINVKAAETYDISALYGFCGAVDNGKGYVHFKGSPPSFVIAVPKGFYNVTLTKAETGRSSVLVNGGALGCNVGIGGGAGREGTKPYIYYMEDVCVSGSTLRISMGEKDTDIAALEVRRATGLAPRKTHIYLGGDSTASAYYPIETSEPAPGRAKTGFGQTLCQFVTADTAITNLGSGGTYAKSWYEIAFEGVRKHAQPGDVFVIMEGINDQSYSNVDEMVEYLSKMVDECRAMGVVPVLCTPMQSPKFWRSDKGKDLSEFENPQGGGKAGFMAGIRKLALDKGVFLIDVADITSKMYGTLGRSFVAQNFHLYNKATGTEEDTLHLSYEGAKNIAGIIATGLYRLQESGEKDGAGAVVSGLTFNALGTASYSYTDASGAAATYSFERIEAVYRRYGER